LSMGIVQKEDDGKTYVQFVTFTENKISFGAKAKDIAMLHELDRTTLVMRISFGVFGEAFQCEVVKGGKQI